MRSAIFERGPGAAVEMNIGRSLRLVPLLCALLSGCGESIEQPLEQVTEKDYVVDPAANFSIRNRDGSIRIYGSDKPEMTVQAIKKAYSADRLNKIAVNISVQPHSVSIETNFPPMPRWGLFDRSGTVDYIIIVPETSKITRVELINGEVSIDGIRGGNVDASLTTGRLYGHNCFGDLRLAVNNGGLDLGYDWWEQRSFSVDAKIARGNARAFIPGDASFHLVAESLNGKVASDFTEQKQRNGQLTKIDTLIGTNPGPDVKIHAMEGNIKIVEVNP
ncbi:MAG TPA: hypothetical protein DCG89_11215 [Spartobacteria bacterium]|nr:hypothetical protein [Spartobacteria bacterium]